MSEITEKDIKNSEKYGYVNTTKLLKFIDSIVDELTGLETEIDAFLFDFFLSFLLVGWWLYNHKGA